jgi:hypothetical protein
MCRACGDLTNAPGQLCPDCQLLREAGRNVSGRTRRRLDGKHRRIWSVADGIVTVIFAFLVMYALGLFVLALFGFVKLVEVLR